MRLVAAIRAFFKVLTEPEVKEPGRISQESSKESKDYSHLRLLTHLQHSSRLVDFLKEDLSSFDDTQIGAVVRKIHLECGKSIEELVTIRPVLEEKEGESIHIPLGYDTHQIKVVGKIKGEPPFKGILVHRGWKAHKKSLPKQTHDHSSDIICPAEVEIK